MNKKAEAMGINNLLSVGVILVVVGIALAFGLQVMGTIRADIKVSDCAAQGDYWNSTSLVCQESATNATNVYRATAQYNGTSDGIEGVSSLTSYLPTIGLVVAAVIVIGILTAAFLKQR